MNNSLPFFCKTLIATLVILLASSSVKVNSQEILFYEGFENNGNNLPSGWINMQLSPEGENWKVAVGAGPFTAGQTGLPDTAAVGSLNAYFRVPSANPHITRLISPPINLQFAVFPELTFWHAQYPRNGAHSKLVVYYSENLNGPWFLLANYQNPVSQWTQRVFQLPSGLSTVYLAFEGHSGGGTPGSVCIDELTIIETGEMERYLSAVNSTLPTNAFVASGSVNNPILKTEFTVMGNSGTVLLEQFTVKSLNTDDSDLAPQGVKLWFTHTENFVNPVLLGNAQDFTNGTAVFQNLNHSLPTGYSYVWATYDISQQATHGNFVKAYMPQGGIIVNAETYPAEDQVPLGNREIRKTIYYDNFDTDKGWTLNGEWQRGIPAGLGGYTSEQSQTEGPAGASVAFSGENVLGTDLTGLGDFLGNYEPHLTEHQYQAIMPAQDFFYYNNITLSFQRWLNVYFFDRATIDVSIDGGTTWTNVWTNQLVNNTSSWSQVSYPLPQAARKEGVLVRFTIGDTGGTNLQSGWNIDELVITGTFVTTDVGVSELYTPQSNCGLTSQEVVSVQVKNYGAVASPDVIPLAFSLDGGTTWHRDTLYGSIPVGGTQDFTFTPVADFSVPGRYNNVLIKTQMPGDQDPTNDQLHTSVFAVPTYSPDLSQDFHLDDGFWTAYGTNGSWQRAVPTAVAINGAHTGDYAWVTNAFGYHNSAEFSWVESPCLDFTDIENPVLDFFLKTHTLQGIDGAALEYSLDGGHTWSRVNARSHELAWDWYNHLSINSLAASTGNGTGWTGTTANWINPRLVLPVETGNHPSVRLRLLFASHQEEVPYEGIAFDMISIYETPDDIGVTAFITPESDCQLDEQQAITVEISNMGINTLFPGTVIPVGIDDNNNNLTYLEEFVLGSELQPGQTVNYTYTQTFNMYDAGAYSFTAYTLLAENPDFWGVPGSNDSLSAIINVFGFPEVFIGDDIFTTQPDTLLLDAGAEFVSWLWQDGSSSQTFQVTSPNTQLYYVTATDVNGCNASDSILVKTYDMEISAMISPTNDCQFAEGTVVKAELHNSGYDAFTTGTEVPVTVHYEGQWLEDITYILSEDLLPGQTAVVEFNTIVYLQEYGEYFFDIEHFFVDANPANDKLETSVLAHGYPNVYIGDVIYTSQPDTVLLDPGPDFEYYLWQDGSTNQTFQVSSPYTATYWVIVTDQIGCTNQAEVQIITSDAGIDGLISPVDTCQFDSEQQISVSLINNGVDPIEAGTPLEMELFVNQTLISLESIVLQQPWLPQTNLVFSFTETADMSQTGTYQITVNLLYVDGNLSNNTFTSEVTSIGYPEIEMPDVIVTNSPDTILLDAGPGYNSYLWNTGHTGQTLQATTWGTYWVSVGNEMGCLTTAYIELVPEILDFGISGLTSPADGCQSDFINVPVIISVFNAGNAAIPAGEQFSLTYQVEGQALATEPFTIENDLMPGAVAEHTFTEFLTLFKNDIKNDSFIFQVWLTNPQDENPDNDFYEKLVNVHPVPRPDLGDTIYNALPQGVILSPQDSYQEYLWQDGSTGSEYQITSPFSEWYKLEVIDFNGCVGADSVMVIAYDLEITDLISPVSNCTLSSSETVEFIYRNNGPDTFGIGHVVTAGYSLNNIPMVMNDFELTTPLGPGQEIALQFPQPVNLNSTGEFSMRVKLMQPDVDNNNSELFKMIDIPGIPYVNLGPTLNTSQPDTIVLFAGNGFSSYLWQDGNTDPYFNVYHHGWHWVVVTDQYGCTGSDTLYIGQAVGIYDPLQQGPEVMIFPNPASNKVTVRVSSAPGKTITIELWNQNGTMVLRKEPEAAAIFDEQISLEGLPAGVYYVRVMENQLATVRKLIITP